MKMNDVYPNGWLGDGIFSDLQLLDVPWKQDNINGSLDTMYYSHSGEKLIAPIITRRLVDGEFTQTDRNSIALGIFTFFGDKWIKLYNTLNFDYDPIENYRMTESESIDFESDFTNTDTGTLTHTGTRTETDIGTIAKTGENEYTENESVTNNDTSSNENLVYAFNSSNAVNSDENASTVEKSEERKKSYTESPNETETHNLTHTITPNETETHNLTDRNMGDSNTDRQLSRYGNIGVTTSQQMIMQEREVSTWLYFETVFNDIDSILCLEIY